MRIGVLSANSGSSCGWHVKDLQRACKPLGLEIVPLDYRTLSSWISEKKESLYGGKQSLQDLDCLLVRAMPPGSLEQVVFRMNALNRLSEMGTPVFNHPKAIECAVDKYLALGRLVSSGLSVPETRVTEQASQAMENYFELGGDVVVKPVFGSEGRGLMRVCSEELALRVFVSLERIGAVIYQQKFISNPGWDLRVFVIGKRVVASMRRSIPSPESWRTNISQGGRGEPYEISETESNLALQASRAVGTQIAGVDLLQDEHGKWFILEVNSAPGWRTLAKVARVDIASEILNFLNKFCLPG